MTSTDGMILRSADRHAFPACYDRPAGTPVAYALFVHCFASGVRGRVARWIGGALAERGIAVLRVPWTRGRPRRRLPRRSEFSAMIDAVVAADGYLSDTGRSPAFLIGHGPAGAAALAAAALLPRVVAVATVNTPYDPSPGAPPSWAPRAGRPREPSIVPLARRWTARRAADRRDAVQADVAARIRDLRKALLVVYAPHDGRADLEDARRLFETARHPKSFVALDDAACMLPTTEGATRVGGVLADWCRRVAAAATIAHGPASS